MYVSYIKPVFDFLVAAILLLALSPLILFIILLLAVFNRGKVFFIQERPGKDEKIFRLIKFRTMNERKDSAGNLLDDEQRLTPIGKIIRSSSLDELPQLFNVLRGDMSMIGPRPWLTEYLPLYNDFQRRRHTVKPGITGWAQVNGRNAVSWEKRFELDTYYVDHLSFGLDMKVFWMTVWKILKGEGISGAGSVTMKRFSENEGDLKKSDESGGRL